MLRRLAALALVLASSTALIVEPALASPPSSEEPSEEPVEGPVEGPMPPPSDPSVEPPPPSLEPGSIEFAEPLPEPGGPVSLPAASSPLSRRDEIGPAPASGGAFIAGGAWLLPMAGLGTWALVVLNRQNQYPPYPSEPGIIVAGVGLGVIGSTMLGTGIYRSVKLQRWATRHRVIALPQGSGLLTSGTLAGLVGIGMLVFAVVESSEVIGGISGAFLVSSPIQIAVGTRFNRRYQRTGGWRATQYTLGPLGLQMRF